ncbi:lysylphosphatidylglycerol synthase domain-containing protein [Flammeovirga pacifica]|uniref:Flippase-like domain-containing protein n=1 Tax=Flammeovirga pacifica TaxID=915059 RepID=A0A1S1YYR6_FLAPC|nr:lysylphosphatidylglycerol synthase domain-containing protein [Flammeovirga pacifica]OHX66156.1 hypothetical protein NH26_07230 [Flammeovirga pacifica]
MVNKKPIALILKVIAFVFFIFALQKLITLSPWEEVSFQHPVFLVLALLLMPLNWGIEAFKWKRLVSPLIQLSFSSAIWSVFSGVGSSLVAGRSIGSILGRYWALPKDMDRKKVVAPILFGQWIQGLFTYLFGGLSFFILGIDLIEGSIKFTSLLLMLFVGVVLMILVGGLWFYFPKFQYKVKDQLKLIKSYSKQLIVDVILLSGLRYLIFTLQFVLVLYTFSDGQPWWIYFQWIAIIYLLKTITPALNMVMDLGAREISAFYIFHYFGGDTNIALMSSLIVWGINILIPSLIGLTVRWRL